MQILNEIGSNFWIAPDDIGCDMRPINLRQFSIDDEHVIWTSSGRSAIRLALLSIIEQNPHIEKTALLPPFTCHTVIEPFIQLGFDIHYLPINHYLETNAHNISLAIQTTKASVILFHRYYGFNTFPDIEDIINRYQTEQTIFIEDCTQCLYSSFPKSNAAYHVGSLRKWFGIVDGGFVSCQNRHLPSTVLSPDLDLEQAKIQAGTAKYKYLFHNIGTKENFLNLGHQAEDILSNQTCTYAISPTSIRMQNHLDSKQLSLQRRINYQNLAAGVCKIKDIEVVYQNLPDDVVPLYLPVYTKDREELQHYLQQHNVYLPIVWQQNDYQTNISDDTKYAYHNMICFPIDQRYDMPYFNHILTLLYQHYETR